jgi:bifunctional oligoribonuclease and PAP phosphatase NrnA
MISSTEKQVIELIKRSKKVLVLPSAPMDGDSLGSAVALYMVMKKLEKDVTVVCSESIPEVLKFLPNIQIVRKKGNSSNDFIITIDLKDGVELDKIKSRKEGNQLSIVISPQKGKISEEDINFNKSKSDYDLIITVDCADLTQLGDFYEKNVELFHQIPVINIDHHISNAHFGKINHVDIMASSTTELILPIIEEMAKEENKDLINEDVATLLLAGIITDTGSFQNANTTPKAFDEAAKLVSYGARQQEIIQNVYKTKQLSQLKLWGRVLSKIQIDEAYRIVWSTVSQQDFKDTESTEEETGDIIDELMTNAPGAEVILLMKEKKDGMVSVSIRTTNASIDASKIAGEFGGGGHAQAAGCRLQDITLRDAEYEVINKVKRFQDQRLVVASAASDLSEGKEENKIANLAPIQSNAHKPKYTSEPQADPQPEPILEPLPQIDEEEPILEPIPEPQPEPEPAPKKKVGRPKKLNLKNPSTDSTTDSPSYSFED